MNRNDRSYIDLNIMLEPVGVREDSSLQIRRLLFDRASNAVEGSHFEPLTIHLLHRRAGGGWVFQYPNFPGERITYDKTEPATWQFFTPVFQIMQPDECWHFLGYCNGKDKNIRPLCAIERYDEVQTYGEVSKLWARQVSVGQLAYLELAHSSNQAWLTRIGA